MEEETIVKLLTQVPLLERMQDADLRVLASKMHREAFPANHILFDEGDRGTTLYVIVRGQVSVTKKQGISQRELAKLGPGDYFGEIAILRHIPRTARITTLTPCEFLTIDGPSFIQLYQYFPAHVRDDMQLIIAKRLQVH